MIFSCHGKPLTVSSAVHVSGRPIPRWMSYTSACLIFSPGSRAATPLPASRSGSSSARQLSEPGDARGNRAATVAVVRRRRRRREPGRARVERVGNHLLHRRGSRRRSLRARSRRFAHHVQPHRGVPDVARVVEERAPLLDRVEVLRERLEALPRHAREQRVGRHVLDMLQRAHEELAVLGPHGRDREAAVACDDTRHAVPARRAEAPGPRTPARRSACGCRRSRG